jgi:hypothetical protein
MKTQAPVLFGALLSSVVLSGCAGGGSAPSTCEVLSPAPIVLPTTREDQRVETQSTGDPASRGNLEQNCP